MNRTTARLSAALFTVALVGMAAPAFAHVTVSSTDAKPGEFGKAVFRVPTESETDSTTKLVVTLPAETPFAFVSAETKPGWKATIKEATLDKPVKVGDFELTKAVRTITWTSTGGGIPPSQFDEFAISGGPFPDAGEIAFSAVQTYSDGEVVAWDQVQNGEKEPEHPAPTLTLSQPVDAKEAGTAYSSELGITYDRDNTGRWLGGVAFAVAVVALVVALRENRRRA